MQEELYLFKHRLTLIKLIHEANPQSRPVVIIVFAHVVSPSVRTFQNIAKQNNFQAKTMFTAGETVCYIYTFNFFWDVHQSTLTLIFLLCST